MPKKTEFSKTGPALIHFLNVCFRVLGSS